MTVRINPDIFEVFPELHIGVVVVKDLKNFDTLDILRREEHVLRAKEPVLLELPEIKAWRNAYKTLGVKKGVRVSVESLIKRVSKGKALPDINGLVNLYNALSLKYVFPIGGEDLNTIEGPIQLTYASGDELFKQIGSEINEPPEINEVVYKDEIGCICRRFNWREADRTKLTEHTSNAILFIESLSSDRKEALVDAFNELSTILVKDFGGQVKSEILTKDLIEFDY